MAGALRNLGLGIGGRAEPEEYHEEDQEDMAVSVGVDGIVETRGTAADTGHTVGIVRVTIAAVQGAAEDEDTSVDLETVREVSEPWRRALCHMIQRPIKALSFSN